MGSVAAGRRKAGGGEAEVVGGQHVREELAHADLNLRKGPTSDDGEATR